MTARYSGLVPAAGSGARFGSAGPKQYSPLAEKPMRPHSIARLLAAPEVEIVFVVLPPADTEFREHDWSAFGERLAPLYCGGASRRDSVLNGLVACASAVDPNDWMLVHDAVRRCLGKAELRRLIDEAGEDDKVRRLVLPAPGNLKRADAHPRVSPKPPHGRLSDAAHA